MANLKYEIRSNDASDASVARVDMKLEIVVIPVSDVDRAKEFYRRLGWRLDADFASGDDFRVIQFTPPGSGCSVIFGKNVTAAAPGSAQGLYLIVSDIETAHAELVAHGVDASEVFHDAGGVYAGTDQPYLHETAEHHGSFEAVAPPHDWWDWYAAYMDARERGSSPDEASAAAGRYMADVKHVVVTPA